MSEPNHIDLDRIRDECAARFEHGARAMTAAADKIDTLAGKVDTVCTLLTGNGQPTAGVIYRLAKIEEARSGETGRTRTRADRIWQLASGVILLVVGAAIAAITAVAAAGGAP